MTNKRAPFTPAAARENGLANTTGKLRTTFKPKGKTRVAENTLSQCRKFNCICSSRLRGDLDSWKTLNVYIYSPHKNRDIVFSTVIFDVAYALVRNCRSYLVTVSGRLTFHFWHSYDTHAHVVTRNIYPWHTAVHVLSVPQRWHAITITPPRVPRCIRSCGGGCNDWEA